MQDLERHAFCSLTDITGNTEIIFLEKIKNDLIQDPISGRKSGTKFSGGKCKEIHSWQLCITLSNSYPLNEGLHNDS